MFTLIFLASTVLAVSPKTVTDEQFVKQIRVACQAAHEKNPEVIFLGSGTADLLDSDRPSKIKCKQSNPNPKPGECSDAYPIYPKTKSLAEVVVQEQAAKVKPVKQTKTVWVAWRDYGGYICIAFNDHRLGEYELSTVFQVEEQGRWGGSEQYYINIRYGEHDYVDACEINNAGFTVLTLGKSADLAGRLKALIDLGIIANVTKAATNAAQ